MKSKSSCFGVHANASRRCDESATIHAALRVLSVLQNSEQSLANFRDSLPPVVNTPELRVPCPEGRKFAVVEEVRARLVARGAEVDNTDGVRVREAESWRLLRASNTQDILVLRCEAPNGRLPKTLINRVRGELKASQIDWPRLS
jgi:phosphomannomutase